MKKQFKKGDVAIVTLYLRIYNIKYEKCYFDVIFLKYFEYII